MRKTLGIIGLGALGYPIAQRLLAHGYELYTTVRSEKSRARAEGLGIRVLESPKRFAEHVDTVILLVSNYEQCDECLNGEEGVLTSLTKGMIILASTVSPDQAKSLAAKCPLGVGFLDAPVSGGVSGAENGTLVCMAAGNKVIYDSACEAISAYCGKIVYAGKCVGDAQKIKAINQMLVGIHIAATVEAASLATAIGVDLETLYEIISLCAGNSFIFQSRMPKLIKEDFSVRASVETMKKDTGICMRLAEEAGVPCYLTTVSNGLYCDAARILEEPEDACAVIKLYRGERNA